MLSHVPQLQKMAAGLEKIVSRGLVKCNSLQEQNFKATASNPDGVSSNELFTFTKKFKKIFLSLKMWQNVKIFDKLTASLKQAFECSTSVGNFVSDNLGAEQNFPMLVCNLASLLFLTIQNALTYRNAINPADIPFKAILNKHSLQKLVIPPELHKYCLLCALSFVLFRTLFMFPGMSFPIWAPNYIRTVASAR